MSSLLDANQVIQEAFDESSGGLKVNVVTGSTVNLDKVDSPSFIDGTTINGSAGVWLQIKASLAAEVKQLHIFDTTGKAINVAVGGSGSEVVEFTVGPGNDGPLNINIPASSRISVRSAETTAPAAGFFIVNYLG